MFTLLITGGDHVSVACHEEMFTTFKLAGGWGTKSI